jgi:WD repeat-containing protein 35
MGRSARSHLKCRRRSLTSLPKFSLFHLHHRHIKYVRNLLALRAAGEHCVLVTAPDEEAAGEDAEGAGGASASASSSATSKSARQYVVILCNAIGSPVDSKHIDVRPDFVAMTPFHVAVASSDMLYVWHYRTQVSRLTSVDSNVLRRKEGRERVFYVESAQGEIAGSGSSAPSGGADLASTGGAICSVAASARYLLVGREGGVVHQYQLPSLVLENKFKLRCRPVQMRMNCDSTRFSVIDDANVLTFFDMEARTIGHMGSTTIGEHLSFERKDVWVSDFGWPRGVIWVLD